MAHAAEIDPSTNQVLRVIVVHNTFEPNVEQWCADTYGGVWKQTSYNGTIRKNFAGIGYEYRADIDAFVPGKPFPSWTLDEQTAQWHPPVPMPTDGMYTWDEQAQAWTQIGTP